MFSIDIKSLFLICTIGDIAVIVIFLFYKKKYPRTRSIIYLYVSAKLLASAAYFLFANREILSGRIYVAIANILNLFAVSYESYALAFTVHQFNTRKFIFINLTAIILSIAFLCILKYSPNTWVIAMSFILSGLFGAAGAFLILNRRMNSMQRLAGCFLCFPSLAMFARGLNAVLKNSNSVLLTPDSIHYITYLSLFLISYLLPFLYLLILKEQDNAEIAESELKYRLLFENSGSGISMNQLVADDEKNEKNYIIIDANRAFIRHFGIDLSEITGRPVTNISSNLKQAPFAEIFNNIVKTGEPATFEQYSEELKHYYLVNAYMVDKDKFAAVYQDITERKLMEEELKKTLQNNRILLKELQHRAKNSFAMITGLLDLTSLSSKSEEVKIVLKNVSGKVRALSELYSLIYSSDSYNYIKLDEYLANISSAVADMSDKVILKTFFESISIPMKEAAALGLILTEFITNSIKYAFPEGQPGIIQISLRKNNSDIRLEFSDDGVGLPDDFNVSGSEGLGFTLIRALADQLGGTVTVGNSGGTRCIIEFSVKE